MYLGERQLRREPHPLWEQEVARSNRVAPITPLSSPSEAAPQIGEM
jgi:hypothetical protein